MNFLESTVSAATGGLLGLAGSASTNAANKEINEQNIALQRETNQKNEQIMRESWARDDTAVQRRTKDLVKAGMSPLLAAGAAASNSGPVSMSAPQSKQVVTKSGLEGAVSGIYQGMMAQQSYMDMMARQMQVAISQGDLILKATEQENRNKLTEQTLEFGKIGLKYEDLTKLAQLLSINAGTGKTHAEIQKLVQDVSDALYNRKESEKTGVKTTDSTDSTVKKIKQLLQLGAQGVNYFGNSAKQFGDELNFVEGLRKKIAK